MGLSLIISCYGLNAFRWSLRDKIRRVGRQSTEADSRSIDLERRRISNLMESFWKTRELAGCGPTPAPLNISDEEDDLSDDGDNESDGETDGELDEDNDDLESIGDNEDDHLPVPVEYQVIPLPSRIPDSDAADRSIELAVRRQKAEHLLGKVREAVADRSFQYSHIIRKAPTKGVKTRARTKVISQAVHLTDLARQYNRSRDTMKGLGALEADLKWYRRLEKSDLKASTAILNPNMPGSTTRHVGWIWQVGIDDADSPAAVTECTSMVGPLTICHLS